LTEKVIPFNEGQSIDGQAATAAGVYIPHLCHHPKISRMVVVVVMEKSTGEIVRACGCFFLAAEG
jgi:predicted molibdopterin-dependent oxidoreductase YjgC